MLCPRKRRRNYDFSKLQDVLDLETWNLKYACISFWLTVMTPLSPHWLSKRSLMNLCTGIPTDPSVMIMTGQRPILMVSLLILLNQYKSTSLCPLFQSEKHIMNTNQKFWWRTVNKTFRWTPGRMLTEFSICFLVVIHMEVVGVLGRTAWHCVKGRWFVV